MDVSEKTVAQKAAEKLKKNLSINKRNLNSEILTHSERVAVAAAQVEINEDKVRRLEFTLKCLEEDLFIKNTDILREEGIKVTKDYITGLVNKDPRVRTSRRTLNGLKKQLGVSKARKMGMIVKTDMLKEFCYNYRKEMDKGIDQIKAKATAKLKDEQGE